MRLILFLQEELDVLEGQKAKIVKGIEDNMAEIRKRQWQMDGQKILMNAKRVGILLVYV